MQGRLGDPEVLAQKAKLKKGDPKHKATKTMAEDEMEREVRNSTSKYKQVQGIQGRLGDPEVLAEVLEFMRKVTFENPPPESIGTGDWMRG